MIYPDSDVHRFNNWGQKVGISQDHTLIPWRKAPFFVLPFYVFPGGPARHMQGESCAQWIKMWPVLTPD